MMSDLTNKILEILEKEKIAEFDYVEDSLRVNHEDFMAAVHELEKEGKIEIKDSRELIRLKE